MSTSKKTTKRVTTRDIAAACGISQSSVSMILSHRPGSHFKPETVALVEATAEQLGYIYAPRETKADRLKQTILILCPSLATDYYVALVRSIAEYAETLGYFVLVAYTMRDAEREAAYLQMACRHQMVGAIYTFAPRAISVLKQLDGRLPTVLISDRNPELPLPLIELDSAKSGALVAHHLLELGHRHLAYLSGPLTPTEIPRRRRLAGIRETCDAAGLPDALRAFALPEDQWLATRSENRQYKTGYALTMACFRRGESTTAFIGANDVVAFGCLDALNQLGQHVPEDFSVCGFDNSQEAAYAGISLTSIDHCIDAKGQTAVDILIDQSDHTKPQRYLPRIEYKPQLVIRRSTSPAPKR